MKQLLLLAIALLMNGALSAQFTLEGTVKTETGFPVEGVEVSNNVFTNDFGYYRIENLAAGTYELTPTKNSDYLNGVTVCDLIDIRAHILGMQSLDSPYKIISADVNNSSAITTLDLVMIQRLILELDEAFLTPSWRFITTDFVFPNPNNPFISLGQPNNLNIDIVENTTVDLVATKTGDVNNSALGNYPIAFESDPDILPFTKESGVVSPQDNYVASFKADSFTDFSGFQFTLSYDPTKMEFVEMNSDLPAFSEANYSAVADGAVNVSWFDPITMPVSFQDGEEVFTATFNILEETDLGESLKFTSDYALIATIDATGCNGEVEQTLPVSVETAPIVFSNIELYPNPATETLNISIDLQSQNTSTLRLLNLLGQEVWRGQYDEKTINTQVDVDFLSSGIYMLEIEVDGKRTTHKILKNKP